MPELKPAYLIHGDDHGAVAERRAGLKALAEQQGDAASVEVLDGDGGTPAGVALALSAMTFAIGRRVIVVDGVERWKQGEVEQHLIPAMAQMPPDTTLALFAREEARGKAPRMGTWLDAAAANALVAQVGGRQQRLLRELEKLALESDGGGETGGGEAGGGETQRVSVQDIERRAAHSAEWRSFALADALVGGDPGAATLAYLRV